MPYHAEDVKVDVQYNLTCAIVVNYYNVYQCRLLLNQIWQAITQPLCTESAEVADPQASCGLKAASLVEYQSAVQRQDAPDIGPH